jgi:hypothetical protein
MKTQNIIRAEVIVKVPSPSEPSVYNASASVFIDVDTLSSI